MNTSNFSTAIYFNEPEINHIDRNNLWDLFDEKLKWILARAPISKIYLETHRGGKYVPKETLMRMKDLCQKNNIETAGGVTLTANPTTHTSDLFTTFCYSNPKDLEEVKAIVRYTSEL